MQVDFQLQTVMLKLPKPVPTRVIAGGVVEYIPGRIIKYDTQGFEILHYLLRTNGGKPQTETF